MTSRRSVAIPQAALHPLALWFLGLLLCAAFSPAPVQAADRILQRQRPLSVRWGEIEVSETALVKIVRNEEETTYPNALALVFKARLRQEDLAGLLEGTSRARTQSTVSGTLYVAARMGGGAGDWGGLAGRLQETAGRLTPAGYEGFLGSGASVLAAAAEPASGDFAIVYCVVVPGSSDRGGDLYRRAMKSGKGSAPVSGSTSYREGSPACAAFREAFAGRAALDTLTTGFTVDESLEESLDLTTQSLLQQPPLPLPEGTQLSRTGPPEGATGYSKANNGEGAAHGEMLRRDGGGGQEIAPYVLTVDIKDAALARDLPRGRSLLARWDVSRRDVRLGAPPRTLSEERQSLLMGVFCTTPTCAPDIGALQSATLAKLGASEGVLGAGLLRRAIEIPNLPPDSFTVLCDPGTGREMSATWCLSNVCAKVTNPDEVCADIAGALPQ